MPKKTGYSEEKYRKMIQEGRGSGYGSKYKPWITVRDFASKGRSHRILGIKSKRTHHLFSDLELAVFFMLEWYSETIDVREQFPLDRETTLEIAEKKGIKHPRSGSLNLFLSSDFLVETSNPNEKRFVVQVKYSQDLEDARVNEKLDLERMYWEKKKIPWKMITEKDIPKTFFKNIKLIYSTEKANIKTEELLEKVKFYLNYFNKYSDKTIIEFSKLIDSAYDLKLGVTIREIKMLIAKRYFVFNYLIDFNKLLVSDLELGTDIFSKEYLNASNQ